MRTGAVIPIIVFAIMILSLQTEAVVIPDPDSLNDNQNSGNSDGEIKVTFGYPLYMMTNSPRANATGGCTINWVDEQSGMHNPGALGLVYLDRVFSVALPASTEWFPNYDIGMELKSYSVGLGASRRLLWGGEKRPNIAFGLSYSNMTMEYGTFVATDYNGDMAGSFKETFITRFYSAGVGIDYICRLGLGVTYFTALDKFVGSPGFNAEGKGHAWNLGAVFEAPLFKILPAAINPNSPGRSLHFELNPAASVLFLNAGNDSMSYPAGSSMLTRLTRFGPSVTASVGLQDAQIAGVTFVMERGIFAGRTEEWRDGWEIGLLDILSVRAGRNHFDYHSSVSRTTRGFGVKLNGVIDWYRHYKPHSFENGTARYLADHLSVSFDYAKYGDNGDAPALNDTKFVKLSMSL